MAQKTGQEETEFKSVPETLNLCVNNCGVTGNPSTNNMCQNCFTTTATSSSSVSHKFEASVRSVILPARELPNLKTDADLVVEETKEVVVKRMVNRCSGCKRKVGLTGFRCRCGDMFCSEHRYSDRHDCGYDYKKAGREVIARENPIVRAAKIVKL